MGRTLHFEMRPNPAITVTDEDWDRIEKITKYFNETFRWTCESLGFSSLSFFPRWKQCFKDSGLASDEDDWETVNKAYEELEAKGLKRLQILRELHKLKLVSFHNDTLNLQSARGFCKVAGNEFNAFLVVTWLTEVSKILPNHEFELHDEGKFLKLDIIIKNSKALPDLVKLQESIKWFGEQTTAAYAKERNDALATYEEFKNCGWKEVSFFCRPVNPADFDEHPEFTGAVIGVVNGKVSGSSGQLMAGFGGEYFGHISETEAKLRSKQVFDNFRKIILGKEAA